MRHSTHVINCLRCIQQIENPSADKCLRNVWNGVTNTLRSLRIQCRRYKGDECLYSCWADAHKLSVLTMYLKTATYCNRPLKSLPYTTWTDCTALSPSSRRPVSRLYFAQLLVSMQSDIRLQCLSAQFTATYCGTVAKVTSTLRLVVNTIVHILCDVAVCWR